MKRFPRMRWFFIGIALVACSCGGVGEAIYQEEGAWNFTELSGNWTVGFPRTQTTTAVDSSKVISRVVESVGIDSTEVISEKVGAVTDEEFAHLEILKAKLDFSAQGSLELAPGCAGGGAGIYTYVEGNGEPVTFTITGGCGASLADTNAELAAFIDAIAEIAEARLN